MPNPGETLVEFVLREVGGEVAGIVLVRRLAGLLMPEITKRPLDARPLCRQQFARTVWIHARTLSHLQCDYCGGAANATSST